MIARVDRLRQVLLDHALTLGPSPLMARPDGSVATLAEGYIPLLVNFTEEDKAAKGLRKLKEQAEPEPPVYFSALEMARDHDALLLVGETGSGKTTFARHLALGLAEGGLAPKPVVRNEFGLVRDEAWLPAGEPAGRARVLPLCVTLKPSRRFHALLEARMPGIEALLSAEDWVSGEDSLLIVLDGLEIVGAGARQLLEDAARFKAQFRGVRLLALAETAATAALVPPAPFVRHALLPLLATQRIAAAKRLAGLDVRESRIGLGAAAANPAQFAMALSAATASETAEDITDAWLDRIAGEPQTARLICGLAADALSGKLQEADLLPVQRVRQLLAARHLSGEPAEAAVDPFRRQPSLYAPVLRSIAARLAGSGKAASLVEQLIAGEGEAALRGALLACEFEMAPVLRDAVKDRLLMIVTTGALTAVERERAGRRLSAWGDPRDLEALAEVPAGTFTFGANTHPNSAPPHALTLPAFRIGLYPVTNRSYGAFVRETGRLWRSPDGFDAERLSAPATDLTWRDAMAYCDWLTARWQAEGRIGANESVRLPTEPEWERAARGDQPDRGEAITYPWGQHWQEDSANSEEAGFNTTCTVGLFARGRSPYGCFDMAGQVWEWCTTLWGDDMATPHFRYPYAEDGREAEDAGPAIRRVLRGGCFSSGWQKACATYRGSLEPDGFWRGNGFRVVVAPKG
ncbi:SUMF1/EgtB/PvdO family nonheme iron enzyme [Rhizobium straminoryzae]|uniref:SUMF1/EgtB/PvdOfamily nonheme iron enzyme n=1 Tax=Rhizobium straminoryzae TaxID=1387186 RepID=A0A549T7G8_9HYPH|nr:SUMF1/EgtB/PvdO family nonheme iron enzyme [Rhizobium straminoryzae]TRL37828.1 SUMF1/EgtB/PvdOfamily nonheme iron enzyme [Rhizobium straminoryzae]